MNISIKTDNLRGEIAPLYCRYQGQTDCQGAYVQMNEDGIVSADYNAEIGWAVTFDVFHNRTLSWGVASRVRGDALADLLESDEMRALFERVHTGHDVEWDGNNNVGHLDYDARAASDEIEAELTTLGEDEASMGAVWDVDQWLEHSAFDDIWETGKTLTEAVTAVEESAAAENIELDGDVSRYLLDRAERANQRDDCYRLEVLTGLHADGRHPIDENGEEWVPAEKLAAVASLVGGGQWRVRRSGEPGERALCSSAMGSGGFAGARPASASAARSSPARWRKRCSPKCSRRPSARKPGWRPTLPWCPP